MINPYARTRRSDRYYKWSDRFAMAAVVFLVASLWVAFTSWAIVTAVLMVIAFLGFLAAVTVHFRGNVEFRDELARIGTMYWKRVDTPRGMCMRTYDRQGPLGPWQCKRYR